MSVRMTESDYQAYLAEHKRKIAKWRGVGWPEEIEEDTPDPGKEEVLAGKIMAWCKERGYPVQCFRQSKKAKGFLLKGFPD